jgi:hypothetical protein
MRTRLLPALLPALFTALASLPAHADEGMWLLTNPPTAQIKSRYAFEPTPDFLLRMQRAAVRFGGASGSVVSPKGLVLTNHHVAIDWVQQLSTPTEDLVTDGFVARSLADERPIPGAEVSILWEVEDVTAQVKAAGQGKPAAEANAAILKAIAALEKSEQERTSLTCRVITLYGGGQYHLYRSKRFTDVRLVFAPESQAANFGGDTDNFEYPRFALDASLVRLYENNAPAETPNHLSWSKEGSREGDLVMVFGHPGRTQRQLTLDELRFVRDAELPARLRRAWRLESKYEGFSNRSPEHARVSETLRSGVANGRKAMTGSLAGLHDPALIAAKADQQESLLAAAGANRPAVEAAIARLRDALAERRTTFDRDSALLRFGGGDLLAYATTLMELADELPKPSGERLREYRDSALPAVYQELDAQTPIYPFYEQFQLADALSRLAEHLGADDPIVKALLAGRSPTERAQAALASSNLADASIRAQLRQGGRAALDAANDPLVAIARVLDPHVREARKRSEDRWEAVSREVYATLADARFAALGDSVYPDATGTLRLSYGTVSGYTEDDGIQVPAFTTFAGLYQRAAARAEHPDFKLPPRLLRAKERLQLSTPYNLVCTADIIGGNSGSPLVNTKGEVVGLIFDGNIQSLATGFQYSDRQSRALAVDSRAILETLRSAYDAPHLANELTARASPD